MEWMMIGDLKRRKSLSQSARPSKQINYAEGGWHDSILSN